MNTIETHETHISVVYLDGEYAYKTKKPIKNSFLDYSTLERRRFWRWTLPPMNDATSRVCS